MTDRKSYVPVLTALGVALVLTIAVQGLGLVLTGAGHKRFLALLGYNLTSGGLIQSGLYFLFTWGILELVSFWRYVNREAASFSLPLLSQEEQYVYYFEDVNDVKLRAIDYLSSSPTLLADLVKKAATKYIRSGSVSQVMEVVSTQARIHAESFESRQSWVRYTIWALPALGFIGTVWGISSALGAAEAMVGTGEIRVVTDTLSVAFDTTFMALFLSLFLMALFHQLQEKTEQYFLKLEEYVMENFVNRIEREE